VSAVGPFDGLAEARWVAWVNEPRGDKMTKVPHSPHRGPAKANDPRTWGTRSQAEKRAKLIGGGIGIELGDLGDGTHLAGIDLDSCLGGVLAPWASSILDVVPSYAEISPSGSGLKVFFRVACDDVRPFLDSIGAEGWGVRRDVPGEDARDHGPAIEVYFAGRFFTVTGTHFPSPHRLAMIDRAALDRLVPLVPPPKGQGGKPETAHRSMSGFDDEIAHRSVSDLGAGTGGDSSRSARALAKARELRRGDPGCTFESMVDALRADPETAAWTRQKGLRNNRRELSRIWDKAAVAYYRNDKGIVANNQGNIRLALDELGVALSYDTFTDRLLIEGPGEEPRRFLGDAEIAALWLTVDREYHFRPTKEFFFDVVVDTARANAFHPVRDYLDGLVWDGETRLDRWLVTYAGAEDSEYVRAVGRLVLVAAVRRVRQPGCKFDEMMVIENPTQGTDKSTGLEVLAVDSDWFSDSLPLNADDKKVIETLSGRWIVEAAELKGIRKGDVEHLKAFLSRRIDRARMSYGRLVTEVPRQCVIIGTTNSERYLRDSTGNRRFWPVRVERFDLAALRRDRDLLWAEAAHAEARGESIRLDPSLYEVAGEEQEERRIEDPFVGMIEAALGDLNGKVTVEDTWLIVNVPEGMRTQEHMARLGEAMRELGWEHSLRRTGNKRRVYVYARGSEEERLLWITVSRDTETRRLYVELVDAKQQQEIEEHEAEEARQRQIPF
jgi:Virulence-associated protein E